MKISRILLLLGGTAAAALAAQRGNPNNQRGDNPGAVPLPAEQEQTVFHLPPGFEIQLVASEPLIGKPFNIAFDGAGRVWITCSELYPFPARSDANGQPIPEFAAFWDKTANRFKLDRAPTAAEQGRDRVLILSDFAPDGRARHAQMFADGLNIPIGVQPLPRRPGSRGDTAVVFSIPAIWRLEDRDGDGRAEVRQSLYSGFGFEDTHGMSSNYTYWLDGWIYGCHGHANHSEIVDGTGNRTIFEAGGGTYRFQSDGSRFQRWTYGQTNPFGTAFDEEGNFYTADSHSKPVYRLLRGGYYEGLAKKHDGLGFAPAITKDPHGSTGIAGIAYYSAEQFPPEYRGNLFNGNPITQRLNRDALAWHGASPAATRMPDFLTCDDPSFRPVQVKLGPDGALWIADFYNPIIGHYEVRLTHPARDHAHGRIWRIVWRGTDRTVNAPAIPNLANANAPALLRAITTPNVVLRTLAVNELVDRLGAPALPNWRDAALARLAAPGAAHGERLALLWALERLGAAPPLNVMTEWAVEGGERGLAVLNVLADRRRLDDSVKTMAQAIMDRQTSGPGWLALAQLFAEQPRDWQAPLLLKMISLSPIEDPQLAYAAKLALKAVIGGASREAMAGWSQLEPGFAEIIADVCLAVPKPHAADFLLAHLEDIGFAGPRVAEYVKQAAASLAPARFDALCDAARHLSPEANLEQQLTVAEGLSLAATRLKRTLPADVRDWRDAVLLRALAASDPKTIERGLDASAGSTSPKFIAAWQKVVLSKRATGPVRASALQLMPRDDNARRVALAALQAKPEPRLLDAIAARLSTEETGAQAHAALAETLSAAGAEQSVTIATALAKTDSGATQLLQLAEAGRIQPRLLVRSSIASALEERSEPIRQRLAALTAALPSESVRLDEVIADRVANYRPNRTDVLNGAKLFTAYCSGCHKFRDAGGSVGPNLDGIGVRGPARLFEDILDPNRNVDPAFHKTTLTTTTGEEIVGSNFQTTGDTVVITDLAGQVHTLPKAQVKTSRTEPLSIMPAIFEASIPRDDLSDIVAYLIGQDR